MEEHRCNNGKQCKRSLLCDKQDEEDRLGSLPDPILIDILSLLPIHSAAATSVLSSRWRNLWTGVTSFVFHDPYGRFISTAKRILSQLTSPIIRKFVCESDRQIYSDLVWCFQLVCRRNVEVIKVTSHKLVVPRCVFTCQSLVTLELDSVEDNFLREHIHTTTTMSLPKLKKLRLCLKIDFSFAPIVKLLKSCPLLEDFCLALGVNEPKILSMFQISAPNLKSLDIKIYWGELHEIIIDTPKLANLKICDDSEGSSLYKFVENPSQLVTADIDFTPGSMGVEEDWMDHEIYVCDIAKFVSGLSSMRKFCLRGAMNLFSYLDSKVDRAMPKFHDLACFRTTLYGGTDVAKDLLLSLQCAPNLEHLEVTIEGYPLDELGMFRAPDCLLCKLKTIRLLRLRGNNYELRLIEYILKNAFVLEQLRLESCTNLTAKDKGAQVANEFNFCEVVFKLPRSSSTSEVVFSGRYIKATSNSMKDGLLDGQIRLFV